MWIKIVDVGGTVFRGVSLEDVLLDGVKSEWFKLAGIDWDKEIGLCYFAYGAISDEESLPRC